MDLNKHWCILLTNFISMVCFNCSVSPGRFRTRGIEEKRREEKRREEKRREEKRREEKRREEKRREEKRREEERRGEERRGEERRELLFAYNNLPVGKKGEV